MPHAFIAAGIISLIGATERQPLISNLKSQMAHQGINVEVWPATTPETLPRVRLEYRCFNTPVEIACLSSHLALIENFYKAGADFGLVFEDDAILNVNFNLAKIVQSAPHDWEILSFGTNNGDYFKQFHLMHEHGGPNWLSWNKHYWGSHAYIIRRQAIERYAMRFWHGANLLNLTELYDPFLLVADSVLFRLAKTYVSRFPWAAQDSAIESTIQVGKPTIASITGKSHRLIKDIWADPKFFPK
jgi:GR25 family glycosyltransferase involved in LPS biosynthesis